MKIGEAKPVRWLWSVVWFYWLRDGRQVVRVKRWNTAHVQGRHGEGYCTMTPMVWMTIKAHWKRWRDRRKVLSN